MSTPELAAAPGEPDTVPAGWDRLTAAATDAGWTVSGLRGRVGRLQHPDAAHAVVVAFDRAGRILTVWNGPCRWLTGRESDKSATVVRWLTERNECTLCQLKHG